jgi:hypothetical protein
MYLSQGKGGSEVLVLGSELNQAECISWPTWTWAWKLSFMEYTPVVIWLLETYANPVRGQANANLQDLLRYYSLPFSLWGLNLIHYMWIWHASLLDPWMNIQLLLSIVVITC